MIGQLVIEFVYIEIKKISSHALHQWIIFVAVVEWKIMLWVGFVRQSFDVGGCIGVVTGGIVGGESVLATSPHNASSSLGYSSIVSRVTHALSAATVFTTARSKLFGFNQITGRKLTRTGGRATRLGDEVTMVTDRIMLSSGSSSSSSLQ